MSSRVRYAVVDAFTGTAFKGNPAAVCLLEGDGGGGRRDEAWMQAVSSEFNISQTGFLTRIVPGGASAEPDGDPTAAAVPRFQLRWFTPVAEVKLCGHGTLAAAHFLFTSGSVRSNDIEFITKSGLLTAKRIEGVRKIDSPKISNGEVEERFSIELDFPMVPTVELDSTEVPSIPRTLNGVSMVDVKKTAGGDLVVELASGKDVADLQPQFDELEKCAGRGVIITGLAPHGSGFDFFTRFFCPKLGINEDPVCGSAHCALAPYWRRKLGKCNLAAYMASPRGGRLDLLVEEETHRVQIRGEAVTVMEGFLLA